MRKIVSIGLMFFLLFTCFAIIPLGQTTADAADAKPTVYICGDSTVQSYSASYAPQAGWGQFIAKYFTSDVLFVNKAIAGRSSKSFIADGRLDEIIKVIKANDYIFIQFGHNDATISKPERYAEAGTTYKECLRQFIDRAKEKGAFPVLITPVARLNYVNGAFKNDFPAYCTAMKEVAKEKNVPCIDLMNKCLSYYTSLGYDKVYPFYMVSSNGTDYTHFTEKGAMQVARIVSESVKELGLDISKFVKGSSTPTNTPTLKPTSTPTIKPTNTVKPTNTATPSPTNTPILHSEDLNGDNVVNMADVILIGLYFNQLVNEQNKRFDVNKDGVINMSDVMKIAISFNKFTISNPGEVHID
ncbi:SGNH/GDSL hydrolase family protein [Pseudobacteroides cellulosolvens]|uniref:SGNH/GDSL hydrolase family protein n=1 Tax=Pseudobacteroides cellulosolvens TaxID=35825 RepID=UPI00147040A1|nr:SGNH/GDSL hydrolase family protein [Pseudobacteroides cellulosolvens]